MSAHPSLGQSVAGAGDVNGDGYADLAVGANLYDNVQTNEGALFVYYGGGSTGASNRDTRLRLYNTDLSTPLSRTNQGQAQFGLGLRAASPYGRVRARLVWETRPNGQPFSSNSPLTNSTQFTARGPWTDLPAGSVPELKTLVSKVGRVTRVRARLEYASAALASNSPANGTGGVGGQVRYGPWQYLSAQQLGQSSSAATPLPVVLTAFTVTAAGPAAVRLAWATASEQHSARFEVERSTDGAAFERLGTVAAAGSSSAPRSYELLDPQVPKFLSPQAPLYYRLRQVDLDGTAIYSPVRAVALGAAMETAQLLVFPNPTRGTMWVRLSGPTPAAPLELFDGQGRWVRHQPAAAPGTDAVLPLAGLPAGVYVLRCGPLTRRLVVE